jgi:glycosyltransferase involved in cell wall biosynthesis
MSILKGLVSIGMPVYNEERHLAEALDHALAQDYEQFELIISDNASEDRTGEICREYARKDGRIRYHRYERNVGASTNFKKVFELSQGEYFTWFSGHDLHEPAFLSRCVDILARDPTVILAYPQAVWVDADGRALGPDGDVISTIEYQLDTRSLLDGLSRFQVILWGLRYCYLVYGVYRAAVLRRARLGRQVIGTDVILLSELAFEGTFAHVPEPLLLLRKLPEHGSWEKYLEKVLGKGGQGRQAKRQFWKMVYDFARAVAGHVRSPFVKGWVAASVAVCMLTKYKWIRKANREAWSRRRREAGSGQPQPPAVSVASRGL